LTLTFDIDIALNEVIIYLQLFLMTCLYYVIVADCCKWIKQSWKWYI